MRRSLLLISLGMVFAGPHLARADFISQVLNDGPVGFWLLNDAQGTPTTAVDLSVNGFNGVYNVGVTPQGTAGPAWVPPSGLVADFGGAAPGTVNFASPLDLGANQYTIAAWINPAALSLTRTTRIVASGDGHNGYGFGTTAGGELVFTTYSVNDYETTRPVLHPTLVPNEWQYVAIVLDSLNDANFYVNGLLVETVSGTSGTQTPNTLGLFTIGNESPSPSYFGPDEIYSGGLAGVSVYHKALTAGQIKAQFDAAATVPEASSLALNGLAVVVVGWAWWRRRRNASGASPL